MDDLRSTDGQIIGTSTSGASVTINNTKEIATLEAKRLLILEGIKEEESALRQSAYDQLDLKKEDNGNGKGELPFVSKKWLKWTNLALNIID